MRTVVRHPNGVSVDGKLFLRDDYYATDRTTLREWLALGVLIVGFLVWAGLVVGGAAWLVWMVVRGTR
jgi:hypothetical protein